MSGLEGFHCSQKNCFHQILAGQSLQSREQIVNCLLLLIVHACLRHYGLINKLLSEVTHNHVTSHMITKECNSLVSAPDHHVIPARKRVWYLTSAFLVVLSQHVNVNCIIRPDREFVSSISGLPVRTCVCRVGTTFMSHDSLKSSDLIGLPVFQTC